MNGRAAALLCVLAIAGMGAGGYALGAKSYSSTRMQLVGDKGNLIEDIQAIEAARARLKGVNKAIDEFAGRTLGSEESIVDHELRTRLSRFIEDLELQQHAIGTKSSAARGTPASRRWSNNKEERKYRNAVDFVELEGSISGEGTIGQAMRLIRAINAEPWLNRIDQVRLEPRNGGERMAVTLQLTTIFVPGRAPSAMKFPERAPVDIGSLAALAAVNPFRVPAPQEEVAHKPADPQPDETRWAPWLLTGIASGPAGPEAWLRNSKSGKSRSLQIGQNLNGATLLAASGERAEFQFGQEKYHVLVGHSLEQRTPMQTPADRTARSTD